MHMGFLCSLCTIVTYKPEKSMSIKGSGCFVHDNELPTHSIIGISFGEEKINLTRL